MNISEISKGDRVRVNYVTKVSTREITGVVTAIDDRLVMIRVRWDEGQSNAKSRSTWHSMRKVIAKI